MSLQKNGQPTPCASRQRPDVAAARATWRRRATWADCRTAGLSRRDLGADEHGPALWPVHRAANGWWNGHSPWPLEDNHVHCRPASRPDHRALSYFDGPINGASFLAWVQQALVPTLSAGDIVIMDNLSSHKVAGHTRGHCRRSAQPWLYLCRPLGSPDLNPIEQVFAKLSSHCSARSAPEPSMTSGGQLETPSMNSRAQPNRRNYLVNAGPIPSKPDVL